MTVSEQIDQFIAENGGNARDALNVALVRLYLAKKKIEFLKKSLEQYHSMPTEFESGGRIEANPKMIEFLIKREEKLPDSQ